MGIVAVETMFFRFPFFFALMKARGRPARHVRYEGLGSLELQGFFGNVGSVG